MNKREIKFRAWDLLEKRWDKPKTNYAKNEGANRYFNSEEEKIRFNRGDIILMQYTGLKDKDGKEIYEGDIVRFKDWEPKIIAYQDSHFAGFTLANTQLFLTDYDAKNIEIIGNVHENPELLKDKP